MTTRKGLPKFTRALPILLAITLAVAGCTGGKPQLSPPGEVQVPPVVEVAPPVKSQTVAVYFPDWQVQHMIPEARQVPEATGAELATLVVKELLTGPVDPQLLRPIPGGVSLLDPVTVTGGVARVNLSQAMQNLHGSASVTAALNALRLSLTEIDGIDKVEVLIEGQAGGTLDGLVLAPMDRGLYLYPVMPNPERAQALQSRYEKGLDPWRADPVKVAQWEGRMFGFTTAELEGAKVAQQGASATVAVSRGGTVYTFTLAQNPVTQGKGIWTIQALDPLARHTLSGLPAAVRTWADHFTETTVGVSRRFGDRTYVLAAVEAGSVQIDSVAAKNGQLVVSLTEQGSERLALASVTGADAALPVVFQWKSAPVGKVSNYTLPDTLPAVVNALKLPDAKLTGDFALVTPTADQTVSGSIAIKGYARHLFEASVVARLFDRQGKEVASANTLGSACCFDWGSFELVLKHNAPAGNYDLELGDYSPKDGTWVRKLVVPVKVGG